MCSVWEAKLSSWNAAGPEFLTNLVYIWANLLATVTFSCDSSIAFFNTGGCKWLGIFLTIDWTNSVAEEIMINNSEQFKGGERERICINLKGEYFLCLN